MRRANDFVKFPKTYFSKIWSMLSKSTNKVNVIHMSAHLAHGLESFEMEAVAHTYRKARIVN